MQLSNILFKRPFLVAVFLSGVILSSVLLSYFIQRNLSQRGTPPYAENTETSPRPEQTNFGLPARLKIPGIGVDAAVESVGLTADGAMDTPKGPDDVAWFNLGQRPGELGSAVIAGHYGAWKNGKGSVFDKLHTVHTGDKIYIEDDAGITASFVVREIRRYDPTANAQDVFGSSDGRSHLNLITCEGTWNKDSKSYSRRLVVFTDKE